MPWLPDVIPLFRKFVTPVPHIRAKNELRMPFRFISGVVAPKGLLSARRFICGGQVSADRNANISEHLFVIFSEVLKPDEMFKFFMVEYTPVAVRRFIKPKEILFERCVIVQDISRPLFMPSY